MLTHQYANGRLLRVLPRPHGQHKGLLSPKSSVKSVLCNPESPCLGKSQMRCWWEVILIWVESMRKCIHSCDPFDSHNHLSQFST